MTRGGGLGVKVVKVVHVEGEASVAAAVEAARHADAVDVDSGVSVVRGKKSPRLVAAFVRAVRSNSMDEEDG